MAVLTITPGTLPQDFSVVTWQEVLDAFAQYMTVEFDETYKLFVVDSNTPGAGDQDKIWFEVDGSGNPVNINYYNENVSDWLSFINPSSFTEGALITFDSNGNQVEFPIGDSGRYLGSDGTEPVWNEFPADFGDKSGRLLYFNSGGGYYSGEWPDRTISDPFGTSMFFGTFDQPTGTFQIALFIQLWKPDDDNNGTLTFKDGSTERQVFDYNGEDGSTWHTAGYAHALECTLTNGQIPTLTAGSGVRLLGAQIMVFQK